MSDSDKPYRHLEGDVSHDVLQFGPDPAKYLAGMAAAIRNGQGVLDVCKLFDYALKLSDINTFLDEIKGCEVNYIYWDQYVDADNVLELLCRLIVDNKLKELRISSCRLPEKIVSTLADSMSKGCISEFSIHCRDPLCLIPVIRALQVHDSPMIDLNLSCGNVDDGVAHEISLLIAKRGICTLNLSRTGLSSIGAAEILRAIATNKTEVGVINLAENDGDIWNETTLSYICQICRTSPLITLELSGTKFPVFALSELSLAVRDSHTIEMLSLRINNISLTDIKCFIDWIGYHMSLRWVRTSNTPHSDEDRLIFNVESSYTKRLEQGRRPFIKTVVYMVYAIQRKALCLKSPLRLLSLDLIRYMTQML